MHQPGWLSGMTSASGLGDPGLSLIRVKTKTLKVGGVTDRLIEKLLSTTLETQALTHSTHYWLYIYNSKL